MIQINKLKYGMMLLLALILTVNVNAATTAITMDTSSGNVTTKKALSFQNYINIYGAATDSGGGIAYSDGTSAKDVVLSAPANLVSNVYIRLPSSGFIGTGVGLMVATNNGTNIYMGFTPIGTIGQTYSAVVGWTNLPIVYTNASGMELAKLTVLTSGNVGINTNSPNSQLHLRGNLLVDNGTIITPPVLQATNNVWMNFNSDSLMEVTNTGDISVIATNLVPGTVWNAFIKNEKGSTAQITYVWPAGVDVEWYHYLTNSYVTNISTISALCISTNKLRVRTDWWQ